MPGGVKTLGAQVESSSGPRREAERLLPAGGQASLPDFLSQRDCSLFLENGRRGASVFQ